MKLVTTMLLGLLAGTWGWRDVEEAVAPDRLLVDAVSTIARMHRMTEQPFRMETQAAFLCVAPARSSDNSAPGDPHHDYFCHVYITDDGVNTMKSGLGTYPVGTIIIKQKLADKQGKKIELYTLMRKMEAGYDPEHGDWEYSVVDKRAKTVLSRGRTDSCIECHQAHYETDYVTRAYLQREPGLRKNEP